MGVFIETQCIYKSMADISDSAYDLQMRVSETLTWVTDHRTQRTVFPRLVSLGMQSHYQPGTRSSAARRLETERRTTSNNNQTTTNNIKNATNQQNNNTNKLTNTGTALSLQSTAPPLHNHLHVAVLFKQVLSEKKRDFDCLSLISFICKISHSDNSLGPNHQVTNCHVSVNIKTGWTGLKSWN